MAKRLAWKPESPEPAGGAMIRKRTEQIPPIWGGGAVHVLGEYFAGYRLASKPLPGRTDQLEKGVMVMRVILLCFALPFSLSQVSGCSSAAWGEDLYGPRHQGFIGSAAGYEDQQIRDNMFFVAYHGASAPNAAAGFHRRAAELCQENGYRDYALSDGPGSVSGGGSAVEARGTFGSVVSSMPIQSGYIECQ